MKQKLYFSHSVELVCLLSTSERGHILDTATFFPFSTFILIDTSLDHHYCWSYKEDWNN
jgi:hypothetical protein